MTPGARYAAAIEVLDGFLAGGAAEKLLSNWARKNRYAGSKDRAAVRDIVFGCLRQLRSCATALDEMSGRSVALGHCIGTGLEPSEMFSGQGYAPTELTAEELAKIAAKSEGPSAATQANLPDWLFDLLSQDLGAAFASAALALQDRAPVDLRVNTAKTTVAAAAQQLRGEGIDVAAVPDVATALRVLTNPRRVANSSLYQQGKVELQDAASQAVVAALDIQAGHSVLDYCAGGGGKTLAMAAQQPKAKYSAWDISAARMNPLKERAARAGASVKVLAKPPVKGTYDFVLADAPCSGSGAWRRNPEGKWTLTPDGLTRLQSMQNEVIENAAECVVSGGILTYATCSVISRENRGQVDIFLSKHPEFTLVSDRSFEITVPGDGFYCATLHKQL